MRKLILIAHTSLDGFVAGTKGELDDFQGASESLDFVNRICETADAALFGRISYKLLNDYWPDAAKQPALQQVRSTTQTGIAAPRRSSYPKQ
jgi:hypothetical protein